MSEYESDQPRGSVAQASLWMIFLSILLVWLPLAGPLIAGYVGGRKSGGLLQAVVAVFLPGVLFLLIGLVLGPLLGLIPIIGGLIAGLGGLVLSTLHVGPLLVGAVVGGAVESSRRA